MKLLVVATFLSIVGSGNALVQLNKNKLGRLAEDLGVSSFLEVEPATSFAATPADLDSGDFEIKCKTTCGFAKSGAILEAGNGGGAAALEAAKSLAEVQDELKEVQDQLMKNPSNAALQAKEIHLQAKVQDKVQALQAAAGLPQAASGLESTAVALAAAKKKLENSEAKYNEAPTPALEASIDLQKAEVQRLEALLKAQKNPNTDLDAKISKMKERLAGLKAALAATPDDAALKDEIATLEDSLQKESEDASFQPKVVCSRVCMDHEKSNEDEDAAEPSDSCMRMCVSVMRHVVYHLAEEK
jgi:hypothetical protein